MSLDTGRSQQGRALLYPSLPTCPAVTCPRSCHDFTRTCRCYKRAGPPHACPSTATERAQGAPTQSHSHAEVTPDLEAAPGGRRGPQADSVLLPGSTFLRSGSSSPHYRSERRKRAKRSNKTQRPYGSSALSAAAFRLLHNINPSSLLPASVGLTSPLLSVLSSPLAIVPPQLALASCVSRQRGEKTMCVPTLEGRLLPLGNTPMARFSPTLILPSLCLCGETPIPGGTSFMTLLPSGLAGLGADT